METHTPQFSLFGILAVGEYILWDVTWGYVGICFVWVNSRTQNNLVLSKSRDGFIHTSYNTAKLCAW